MNKISRVINYNKMVKQQINSAEYYLINTGLNLKDRLIGERKTSI